MQLLVVVAHKLIIRLQSLFFSIFSKDNTPWTPKAHSRICSAHFIGGAYSREKNHPSYVPTAFPEEYKKTKSQSPSKATQRYTRAKKRSQLVTVQLAEDVQVANDTDMICDNTSTADIGVQADFDFEGEVNIMFLSSHNNDVSTQTCLMSEKATTTDASSNTDIEQCTSCKGYGRHHSTFCGYCSVKNEDQMRELSGVTFTVFKLLLQFLTVQSNFKVTVENRLFLFLMRVKLGFNFSALSCLYSIDRRTASRIFYEVLESIHKATANWVFWPDVSIIKSTLPQAFHADYPNCRAIIDCFEVRLNETPQTVEQRVLYYSNYKSGYTVKYLIAIAPNGFISFLSKGYGGRSSDGFITVDSKLVDLIEPDDLILADKGFPKILNTMLGNRNAVLVMPPRVESPQLSAEDVGECFKVASVRVHVERAIQRIRLFNILRNVNSETMQYIDPLVHFCCVLVNLQSPILKDNNPNGDE